MIVTTNLTHRDTFATGVRLTVSRQYVTSTGEPDRIRVVLAYPSGHRRAGEVIRERWCLINDSGEALVRQAAWIGWERGAANGVFAQAYVGTDDPAAPLSGEYAGTETPQSLAERLGIEPGSDLASEAADAYETAYYAAHSALYAWADSDDADDAPTFAQYAAQSL